MIQANELRIGNLISYLGDIVSVSGITKDSEKEGLYYISTKKSGIATNSSFQNIELTEEILLKCGFRKENNVIPIYTLDLISIYWNSEYYPNGRLYFNSWCILKEKPKYLHQLQNLYFALTNEELNIEL